MGQFVWMLACQKQTELTSDDVLSSGNFNEGIKGRKMMFLLRNLFLTSILFVFVGYLAISDASVPYSLYGRDEGQSNYLRFFET